MRDRLLSLFIFFVVINISSAQSSYEDTPVISLETENKIKSLVEEGNLPSMQVAVVSGKKISVSFAIGENTGIDYAYMNGSVQKVFDAVAVLQLYEEGLIDIYKDVNNYLPFSVRHPKFPDKKITIQMLLSHRSGLESFRDQFTWDTEGLFEPEGRPVERPEILALSLEEFIRASLDPDGINYSPDGWHFEPGTNYIYSVAAYPMLRYMIEHVSGQPYPDYMRENIFLPLEMTSSGFTTTDTLTKYAIPFTRLADSSNKQLPLWEGNGYMMHCSADDMARFMIAIMNNGQYRNYQLLKPETIALMQEKHSPGKNLLNMKSNCPFAGYGLGIIQYSDDWFGHGGSTVGFQSLWSFNRANSKGYIIMTNINGILGGKATFNSVWGTVEQVETVLKSELDPHSDWTYKIILLVSTVILFSIIFFLIRRKRST